MLYASLLSVDISFCALTYHIKLYFVLDDRGLLAQAEIEYIQQNVNPDDEEKAALAFPDSSTGTCPTSWITKGEKTESSTVTVDWEGVPYATILAVSSKNNFHYTTLLKTPKSKLKVLPSKNQWKF